MPADVVVATVKASAYTIPTDFPEADGTASWGSTTIIIVEVEGGGEVGIGYSYTGASVAQLINKTLAKVVCGCNVMDPPASWRAMQVAVRNLGRSGLAATGISAVDVALHDLKAKLLGVPLATMLGRYRNQVPIYGSGGFTSYDDSRLATQLAGWVERDGCQWVKMKVGTHPDLDPARVMVARNAIGDARLFVDANGAYSVKQAIALADCFASNGVEWFEEPVSSDDLTGLRRVRDAVPASMEVAAGEYGYDLDYFGLMLASGAVDVQQADATRCGGVTGFLQAAVLCESHHVDLSAHCAPSLHRHLGCVAPRFRHLEWFHDHVRIEHMLFEGAPVPQHGLITPEPSRPGLGLIFKRQDAEQYVAAAMDSR